MIDAFTLERINAVENAAHVWGTPCPATCPLDGVYDCEDFAAAKSRALIAEGAAPADTIIRRVVDEVGQSHMILVYRGKTALDNRFRHPMPVRTLIRIGYKGLSQP